MKALHKFGPLIFLLFKIAVLIAVPFLVVGAFCSHTINDVEKVKYIDGRLYGLDAAENADYLFEYDVKKGSGHVVKSGDLSDMTFSAKGDIYLLQNRGDTADIVSWNKKMSLNAITEVARIEGLKAQRITAASNGIFYIYYINDAGDEIHRYGYNEEWQPSGQEKVYPCSGFSLKNANISDSGDVYFVSANGSIYGAVENDQPRLIFDVNNGPEDNTAYANYRFSTYNICFSNLNSGKYYSISVNDPEYKVSLSTKPYKSASSFDDINIHKPVYTGDTVKAGGLNIEDGTKAAAVCGDVEAVVSRVEWSALQYIISLLIVAGILVGLWFIFKKPISRLETKMLASDFTILISVTTILMIICLIISTVVLVEQLKKHQINEAKEYCTELAEDIVEQLSTLDVTALAESGETPLADAYAQYDITMVFYEVRDGEVYYAATSSNAQVPCDKSEPGLNKIVSRTIEDVIRSEGIAKSTFQVDGVRNSGVVVSMGSLFGSPSAMLVAFPMIEFWKECWPDVLVVALANLILLIAIFVVIQKMLFHVEKQLYGLMDASARVLRGELGAQANDEGINEVAATIRAFNRMSAKLRREEDSVSNCQIVTKAFTPLGLMRQINGGFRDTSINIGAAVEGRAQILAIIIKGLDEEKAKEEKEEYSKVIDRFVNVLAGLGGSLMDVTYCSLRYIDAEMKRDLFRSVMPLIQELNIEGKYEIRAVLHVTDIKASIVGTEEYMILDAYETKPQGTKELFENAQQKGISLLMTDFAVKIAGIDRYHFRKVGLFSAVPTGKAELLYEALDACSQSDARARMETRDIFEKGLKDMYLGKISQARRAMARVMIEDPEDTVARFYLKECEAASEER